MKSFARLLDRLAFLSSRNAKLALLAAYFRETPDPERGIALAALTGDLQLRTAKPNLIRDLVTERVDPVATGHARRLPRALPCGRGTTFHDPRADGPPSPGRE